MTNKPNGYFQNMVRSVLQTAGEHGNNSGELSPVEARRLGAKRILGGTALALAIGVPAATLAAVSLESHMPPTVTEEQQYHLYENKSGVPDPAAAARVQAEISNHDMVAAAVSQQPSPTEVTLPSVGQNH